MILQMLDAVTFCDINPAMIVFSSDLSLAYWKIDLAGE